MRACRRQSTYRRLLACDECEGTGVRIRGRAHGVPNLFRAWVKVRAQQGFFTVERACPTCQGTGQMIQNPCKSPVGGAGRTEKERSLSVNIPAGVETGTRIRLAGEGEAGMRGGPSGDLYIFIEVSDHTDLRPRGHASALPRPRVDERLLRLVVTSKFQPSTVVGRALRFQQAANRAVKCACATKGMPGLRGGPQGDMYIELAVETPVKSDIAAKRAAT